MVQDGRVQWECIQDEGYMMFIVENFWIEKMLNGVDLNNTI